MLLQVYPLQLEPLALWMTSRLVSTRRFWWICYSYHLGRCGYYSYVTLHTSTAGKVMTTSHTHVQREGSENVSEQFLEKFKFSLQSSASSGILENTFFMHMFFIKCSCQNRPGLMFLKRCREEKTNGWNKAGMCLLCLGKNHHFCRAFRATFKLAGSGTGSCVAVGFQWTPYKPNQFPREASTCCMCHSSRAQTSWMDTSSAQTAPSQCCGGTARQSLPSPVLTLPAMLQIMCPKCAGSELKPSTAIW